MKKIMGKFFALVLIFTFIPINSLLAAEYYFNPNFIIADSDMTDYDSMTLIDIQAFLESKNSPLAYLSFDDYAGINKRASEIIWQAAQESMINPKLLLATLQKEQSLVEDKFPSQGQLDAAMGYGCPDSGGCLAKAKGFGKQVDGAAWQFRKYFDTPGSWFYKKGIEYSIDGYSIVPLNQATANLYNYTPHHHGNKRFWQIYQDYFGLDYPDGSLLKSADNPDVWVIKYGRKRHIDSWGVLVSRYDPRKILTVSSTDLEKYETGPSVKFYNYSLLGLPNGKIYLLVDDELRHIASPEVFRVIGFNPEEVEPAEPADLAGYLTGKEITVDSAYPTGALLQNKQTGGVYYVENGIKMPIVAKEIMDAAFSDKILTQVAPDILDQYEEGLPVKFPDGELVKAKDDSQVYVISNGNRVWIKDGSVFANFGYKWDNIIETSQAAINIHPLIDVIE